jgi:penicillin-binding protein 1C
VGLFYIYDSFDEYTMKFALLGELKKKHPAAFIILAALGFLLLLGVCFYLYIAYLLPLPAALTQVQAQGSIKIFDRKGQLLYEVLQPLGGKKTFSALQQIPKNFINATLAAEDIHFYEHGGVDLGAVARALFFNVSEGRIVSGASTITQQLLRNLLGYTTQRGYAQKILEMIYAVRISNLYSKDQILELYLNTIYYGNLAYGSEAAALDYFGKHLYDLDLAEATLVVGLPQAPSYYNPLLYLDRAKKRQKYVLEQMVKYGFVDNGSAQAAMVEPLKLRKNIFEMKAPHFVRYVLNQLGDIVDQKKLQAGGLNVYTTLDYDLQLEAENIISQQVKSLSDKHVSNGALLAIEPKTAKVLSWVGSENYYNDQIDGQVDMVSALRQPGSSIKPLMYLLALEKGSTPATILADVPVEFQTESGPYAPKNYDLDFHGPVRLREALASSFNVPAVQMLNSLGVESFLAFLNKLGIQTLDQNPNFYGLALTLGGGEVRMVDMARAFNVIANYGDLFDLSTIEKITDQHGAKIYEWNQPPKNYVLGAYGKEDAYQIIDILKDPHARLKGFGEGSVLEISHDAAVKTGTTRNFRDNWTIGFTPQLLTTVWVGNADASPMQNISGVDGAGPIWHDFMEAALQSAPEEKFVVPPRLHQVEICALSGKLPTDLCPDGIYEWFVRGQEPKEKDDYYQNYWVLKANGHLIRPECVNNYPEASRQQKTLITYPAAFQRWADKKGLALAPFEPCALSKTSTYEYTNAYSTQQNGLVVVDSPSNHDEFLIDNGLPLNTQKIPFRVVASTDVEKVTLVLDGKKIATIDLQPFNYLWLPQKGRHTLKAIGELYNGTTQESPAVNFKVQ